jgi:hypothetical protein
MRRQKKADDSDLCLPPVPLYDKLQATALATMRTNRGKRRQSRCRACSNNREDGVHRSINARFPAYTQLLQQELFMVLLCTYIVLMPRPLYIDYQY